MESDTQNTQDPAAVLRTLLEAAEQGDVKSQVELATAYLKGRGVPPDHLEAIKWYRKAAEQGLGKADPPHLATPFHGDSGGFSCPVPLGHFAANAGKTRMPQVGGHLYQA